LDRELSGEDAMEKAAMISSAPGAVEAVEVGGVALWIRPIEAQDDRRLVEFFNNLSPHSIYMRFFAPMKELSAAMVEKFTRVDPRRHIALVALGREAPSHPILGIGRVIAQANPRRAEFSIVVADAFQGLGIGAVLLQRCIDLAASRGIEKIWGLVLVENTQMLALGRKLGFAIQRSGGAEYELTIDVIAAAPETERMV
jgi:acetyltransferase